MIKKAHNKIIVAIFMVASVSALIACKQTEQYAGGNPEKVTIAFTALPDTALDQIAAANNYYAREGLTVTRQFHQIGKQALQAVLDGNADFATVAETPVMLSIMNGEKISVIAAIDMSRKNMAIIARKDKGIKTIDDLRSKKIATTFGTIGQFFLDSILTIKGISPKDITAVNLPPDQLSPALENNDVDAVSIWNPLLVRLQQRLGNKAVTIYGDEFYEQFYLVVAKQDYIRDHPEAVRRMLRALIRAEEIAEREQGEAQRIVAENSQTGKTLISEIWGNNEFRIELGQTLILALEDESRWAIQNGLTKRKTIPNYLDYIYLDGLQAVKPEAVRIFR